VNTKKEAKVLFVGGNGKKGRGQKKKSKTDSALKRKTWEWNKAAKGKGPWVKKKPKGRGFRPNG